MCDVLLAYVGEDAPQAEAIAEALETRGFSVGDAYASDAELDASAARIVVWSPAAARSRGLIAAAERFIASGDTLVASLTDPADADSHDLPVFDLSNWNGDPDDARLDPLLDVVRRMAIVAGKAPLEEDDNEAADDDDDTPDAYVPQAARERLGPGWLARVPTAPLRVGDMQWAATAAHRVAAAAQAAPRRSIAASLVIGAFLAGALLTGNLDRAGAPEGARSYAAIPPPIASPVAVEAVADEPRFEEASRAAPAQRTAAPTAPAVAASADVARADVAPADAIPVVTLANYVPPPIRSWEPHKQFVTAQPATVVGPPQGDLVRVKLPGVDDGPDVLPPSPLPDTLSQTAPVDLGEGD